MYFIIWTGKSMYDNNVIYITGITLCWALLSQILRAILGPSDKKDIEGLEQDKFFLWGAVQGSGGIPILERIKKKHCVDVALGDWVSGGLAVLE